MRLGIMQPYFFPYLGYFSLIKHVDKFILFDTAQFIRHGWIERNRILKPGGGWQYFAVPLHRHSQKTAINAIEVNNDFDWEKKIMAQLVHYKKAPYYNEIIKLLQEIFEEEYKDIVTLDRNALNKVCNYINIETEIEVFSEMNLKVDEVKAPDEWALNICKAIEGVNEYWNPPGGKEFFDVDKYERVGIDLKFQKIHLTEYRQLSKAFEEGLSIIDILMFNSKENISHMLDDFELI